MKVATGKPADKLSAQYGGTWSKKEGATSFTNEQGQTAVQVAKGLSRKKAGEKTEYLKKNA